MIMLKSSLALVAHIVEPPDLYAGTDSYFLCPACHTFSYGRYGTLCHACLNQLEPTYCWRYENSLHFLDPEALSVLEHVLPLFLYGDVSNIRKLIFQLKYHGDLRLGYAFGHLLGQHLIAAGYTACFDGIVPVPLHWFKYLRRGYNQSEIFARGLSEVLRIPVYPALRRPIYRKSQTKLSERYARSHNVAGVFALAPHASERYAGQHLLLVDDVLTTGATASECIARLLDIPAVRLSFASIAIRPTLLRRAYGRGDNKHFTD